MREAEARDQDGRLICWASAGIVRSRLAGGDDWSGGGRVDPDEAFLHRVATWAATWAHAPMMARRLRVPEVSPEQLAEVWAAAPSMCVALHVPPPGAIPREQEAPPAGGMAAAVIEWLRDRLKMRPE